MQPIRPLLFTTWLLAANSFPGLAAAADDILQYSHDIDVINLRETLPLPALTGAAGTSRLQRPVALGGRDHTLYIADAGALPKVYRYDDIAGTFTLLEGVMNHLRGEVAGIYVDKNLSFFLADPDGQQVLLFNRNGQLLTTYRDSSNLNRPVAVALDWLRNQVLIADTLYDRIMVFTEAGWPAFPIAGGSDGQGFGNIVDMAQGPAGIYVLSRLNRQVHILTLDGRPLAQFTHAATNPTAIAVDSAQHIYIADGFDDTIRIYADGRLLDTVGGSGSAPGRFRGISRLWAERDRLYVADSLNGRVQVFAIMAVEPHGER